MSARPTDGSAGPVGTIYRAPDKSLYVVARYDTTMNWETGDLHADDDGNPLQMPQYHYMSAKGGSASCMARPDDAERIWTPPPAEPVWEAYVCDSSGFCIAAEDVEGTLALIEDEDAIWKEYGDTIPDRIVVARGDGKPIPQYERSDVLRFKPSHVVVDRIEWDVSEEYAERALQLWQAAKHIAAGMTE